jgi:thiosulfate/3-mercaptopyruvate sulfurtransferase
MVSHNARRAHRSPFRHRAVRVASAAAFVVLSVIIPANARAQRSHDPRSDILVSTAWLSEHLRDPNLVLLHVGERQEYDAGHLPGARYVSLSDISLSDHESPKGLMLQMPTADVLREKLAALGISNNSRVVVYYGNDWVTPATRVIFTLDYAGFGGQSALLDGGMQTWKREKRATTTELPATRRGNLAALRIKPIVVDRDWVKSNVNKSGVAIVDGRSASFYDGVETGQGMHAPHKTGHIVGAKSIPFTEITGDDLKLKTPVELEELFTKAGVKPGDTVVGYCHIGQQATGMLFAARSLGHKVLLYDGSMEDWSLYEDYPVETETHSK